MRPTSLTVELVGTTVALSSLDKHTLSDFAQKLKSVDLVTCTGYAESNEGLALRRADVVARYLMSRIKIHVKLETVTSIVANKVIASIL